MISEKKPVQRQKTDEEPNFFQLYQQEQGKISYMRFYNQQDQFTYYQHQVFSDKLILDLSKKIVVKLPLSRVISTAISDTLIMSKFIYTNSKIVNSLLQNGRQMILGNYFKKHLSWQSFLKRPEMFPIKKAYERLSNPEKAIIEYSVLSISNLILKLSINISKLSCILTGKRHLENPLQNFLSIPTLSVVFLQYMMFTLFQSKVLEVQEAQSQFLRQLPKITYVKFSQKINKQQLYLIEAGQQFFFSNYTFGGVRNIQYIQFYEEKQEGDAPYNNLKKDYQFIRALNVKERLGLEAPFGFKMLFLFRTVYFDMIKDFSPDVIVLVEDYDSTRKVFEPSVRALMMAELMEAVTGKVFVVREVGAPELMRNQEKPQYVSYIREESFLLKQSTQFVSTMDLQKTQHSFNQKATAKHFMTQEQALMIFQDYGNYLIQRSLQMSQLELKRPQKQRDEKWVLETIEAVLRDDVSYIALALIQKTQFQTVFTASHQQKYSSLFLENLESFIFNQCQFLQIFSDCRKQFKNQLEISLKQVKTMKENYALMQNQIICYQDYYDYVWDLRDSCKEMLYLDSEKKELFKFRDTDHAVVYYGVGELLVFVFAETHFTILRKEGKQAKQSLFSKMDFFEKIVDRMEIPEEMRSVNPTYLITDKYIYKGFGLKANNELNYKQRPCGSIYRINYRELKGKNGIAKVQKQVDQKDFKKKKNQMDIESIMGDIEEFFTANREKGDVSLIEKEFGWAMHDQISQNVVFMGGYSENCTNEQKLNKQLHIVSNQVKAVVRVTGKTSPELFLGKANPKSKIPLFPFIYGIPFIIDTTCYILSTNGFNDTLTNSHKLFLTTFKLSSKKDDLKYGILYQQKLFVNYEDEEKRIEIVTAKQFVVHYMVNGYRLKNCFGNLCVLQTLDEGNLSLKLDLNVQANGKKTVGIWIQTDKPQYNGFKEILLLFNPLQI